MKQLVSLAVWLELGGPATADVLFEDFNAAAFPPVGWTVVDNTGKGDWQLNTFFGDANLTGGDGTCADVNTDYYGGMSCCIDTELICPEFVVPDGATLEFDQDFRYAAGYGSEVSDVDISTDGGASWSNLARYEEDHRTEHMSLDLSAYAGESARIRFHHYDAWWEWWWQVDNVNVSGAGFGLGDMNCDGGVNSYDIDGFICAVSPQCDYEGLYPDCDRMLADCNGDGEVNSYDIDAFIALVGGG